MYKSVILPEETTTTEQSKVDSKEVREIAEKIIKQELNRAKVAKFGKSAGGGGYDVSVFVFFLLFF